MGRSLKRKLISVTLAELTRAMLRYVPRGLLLYRLAETDERLSDAEVLELSHSGFGHLRPIALEGQLGKKWSWLEVNALSELVRDLFSRALRFSGGDAFPQCVAALKAMPIDKASCDYFIGELARSLGGTHAHYKFADFDNPAANLAAGETVYDGPTLLKYVKGAPPELLAKQGDMFWEVVAQSIAYNGELDVAKQLAVGYKTQIDSALDRMRLLVNPIQYEGTKRLVNRAAASNPA